MKIDNPKDLSAINSAAAKGAGGVDGGARRGASHGVEQTGPDRAELSGLADKISQAEGHDSATRTANVDKLRGQVVDGSYRADPEAISKGIVNDALAKAAAG